jgi:plastocyanin
MPAAFLPRPSRLILAALVAAVIGVTLVAVSGGPAAAQAQAAKAEIDGTAQSKWEPANVTVKPGGTVTFKVAGGPIR